jgi:hypothetical protein
VKTRTDQTDGQIGSQAAEKEAKSDFKNLSGPETDQTGHRIITDVGVAYEECRHRCDHCRHYGGTIHVDYDGAEAWLHRECEDAWRVAYDALDIRNQPFYRPPP